ncbi:hypothetical protein RSOL_339560, partial [Rhizoctonia solani AG-3 Rhs1AP]
MSNVGSTGLNVTAASVVIVLSNVWSGLERNQIFGRVDRPGQCRDVVLYTIVAPGSIDLDLMVYSESKTCMSNQFLTSKIQLQQTYLQITAQSPDHGHELDLGSDGKITATKVVTRKRKDRKEAAPSSSDDDEVAVEGHKESRSTRPSKRVKVSNDKKSTPVAGGGAAKTGPSRGSFRQKKGEINAEGPKTLSSLSSGMMMAQQIEANAPDVHSGSSRVQVQSQGSAYQNLGTIQETQEKQPQSKPVAASAPATLSRGSSSNQPYTAVSQNTQGMEEKALPQAPSLFKRRSAHKRRLPIPPSKPNPQPQFQNVTAPSTARPTLVLKDKGAISPQATHAADECAQPSSSKGPHITKKAASGLPATRDVTDSDRLSCPGSLSDFGRSLSIVGPSQQLPGSGDQNHPDEQATKTLPSQRNKSAVVSQHRYNQESPGMAKPGATERLLEVDQTTNRNPPQPDTMPRLTQAQTAPPVKPVRPLNVQPQSTSSGQSGVDKEKHTAMPKDGQTVKKRPFLSASSRSRSIGELGAKSQLIHARTESTIAQKSTESASSPAQGIQNKGDIHAKKAQLAPSKRGAAEWVSWSGVKWNAGTRHWAI